MVRLQFIDTLIENLSRDSHNLSFEVDHVLNGGRMGLISCKKQGTSKERDRYVHLDVVFNANKVEGDVKGMAHFYSSSGETEGDKLTVFERMISEYKGEGYIFGKKGELTLLYDNKNEFKQTLDLMRQYLV